MKEKSRQKRLRLLAEAKKKPAVFTVYIVLRLIVVAILVSSILRGEYENAAICLLVLFLFLLPLFVQRNFGIELPGTLEIIILVFIFASEILGELGCFFINVPNWDSILHTTTGFLCAAFGFALIDILNRNDKIKFQLSPIYVALVAFCFSMTIGVLWEFFEFSVDRLFHMDMQKDTIVHTISSVMLDPTNKNIPITIDGITSVAVNGKNLGFDRQWPVARSRRVSGHRPVRHDGGSARQLHRRFDLQHLRLLLYQAPRQGPHRKGVYPYHHHRRQGA